MKKDDAHDERDGQDADGDCRANDRVFVSQIFQSLVAPPHVA